ncbi:MAG: anti-sigma F factor [Erysipelotrichaceae bacterium]|nr:anti-sigma F factor [Erysipelotrichaceae bacterium]
MNKMEVSFSAILDNENFARTTVAAFLTPLNPTIDEIIEVKTIVSEAVSNAIIHGYGHNEKCQVIMKMTIEENKMTLIIQDFGKGIEDIEAVRKPFYTTAKETEHTGMGMSIIETLADSFDIESVVNIGTKYIITKKLHCGNVTYD